MKFFGYDIYLSKNISKEEVEEVLSENYFERIFFYTNFTDVASDSITKHSPGCSYFYIHQHQNNIESAFPFSLQIEALKDEPNKWERAYALVEKICKNFNVNCFIEYPFNAKNPSPSDVLLYMPTGEIQLANDINYEETGLITLVRKLDTIRTSAPMQLKTIGELIKTADWNSENDWVSAKEIPIPFFENKAYTIRFEAAKSTEDYFEKAEEAIGNFFNYTNELKEEAEKNAYEMWVNFNESCGFLDNIEMYSEVQDPPDWMLHSLNNMKKLSNLTDTSKVWQYISPLEVVVTKDRFALDKEIYIQVLCNCDWDEEHGIQFVFKEGKELIRVSEQDGDLFD